MKTILLKLLTDKILATLLVEIAKHLATKSSNTLDDTVVSILDRGTQDLRGR